MDIGSMYIRPQPYSRPLRIIVQIIAERESDADCNARLRLFLERSGIPGRDCPSCSPGPAVLS